MGLNGKLHDLPLFDLLQILAFAKKTGALHLRGPFGSGAVWLRAGRLLCAHSPSTEASLTTLGRLAPEAVTDDLLRQHIEIALLDLGRDGEGQFNFRIHSKLGDGLTDIDARAFMRRDGFDPHEVLLDLARELDEERRHAAELLEFQAWAGTTNRSPGEPASQISLAPDPGEGPKTSRSRASERSTVLLVEDEATVREAVGSALERAGYDVATAESPTEGVTQAQRLFLKPGPLVVVTDLSLPSSNGRSYRGGFELVHRIRRMRRTPGGRRNPVPPAIVLMVERLSRKDRLRTRGLDIEHIVLKPGLSKLDPDEYARDLERLATRTIDAVADCLEFLAARPVPWEKSGPSKPSKQDGPPRDHPYSTATLDDSSAAFLLPRRMLQAAARSSERAVFFVVKEGQARGLLAFGLGGSETADAIAARRLVWDFRRGHGLTEALQTLVPTRLALPVAGIDPSFFARSRTLEGQDAMVLPIPNHGELLALVYVDNPRTGNPLGALQGLGRLAREVGAALEDLGIRRRLRRLAQKMESPNLPVGTAIEVGRGRDGRYA